MTKRRRNQNKGSTAFGGETRRSQQGGPFGQSALERRIAETLAESGFQFEQQPAIGGIEPDFLVRGPEGQTVVIEAKTWPSGGGSLGRAIKQVEHYRRVANADHALVVLDGIKKGSIHEGVVSESRLVRSIWRAFAQSQPREARVKAQARGAKKKVSSSTSRRASAPRARAWSSGRSSCVVFAAMPFDAAYDDTYFVAMAHAAEYVGAVCKRVDQEEFGSDIVNEIKNLIQKSMAVIVDLSESKPNVLYEVGYAHALDKPVVHISSTSPDDLPFDVRNWNTLQYTRGRTAALREPLAKRLHSVIEAQ